MNEALFVSIFIDSMFVKFLIVRNATSSPQFLLYFINAHCNMTCKSNLLSRIRALTPIYIYFFFFSISIYKSMIQSPPYFSHFG